MTDQELVKRLADAIADAEVNSDVEPDWVRHQRPASAPTAVYSVRIPVDRIEELRELAATRGVAPTALIRRWVLAHLDAIKGSDEYARQWERDVRATAAHLQELIDQLPQAPIADAS